MSEAWVICWYCRQPVRRDDAVTASGPGAAGGEPFHPDHVPDGYQRRGPT